MKLPRSKHFASYVQSEISFLREVLESVVNGKSKQSDIAEGLQKRIRELGRHIAPKKGVSCEKCDFQAVNGLGYKRKDGQVVKRLRCSVCGKTISPNRLTPIQLHPYKEIVCIILLLEGVRISDLKKLLPQEGFNYYYWRDKIQSRPISAFISLKANGVEESFQTVEEDSVDKNRIDFSLEDFPSTATEMKLNINATRNTSYLDSSHLRQVRTFQLILLGVPDDEIKDLLNLGDSDDLNRYREMRLKDLRPLPEVRIMKADKGEKKRPVLHRSWDKRCTFVCTLGSRDTTIASLLVYGEFKKHK